MTPKDPKATPSDASYPILIEPDPKDNDLRATKTLYLVLNDDKNDVKEVTVTSPTGGFVEGKAYTVVVTINGPEAITVKASIADWDVVGGSLGAEI